MSTNTIYLTFDDGPDSTWTPRVLDLLVAARMKATFFPVGRNVRRHTALIRRIAADGHEIGNHTWSHRHPLLQTSRQARLDVVAGTQALSDVLGKPPRLFRPPHGCVRQCMVEEAQVWGQTLALWTVSAIDWGLRGTPRGIANRLATAGPEDVVLMHDGGGTINHTRNLLEVLPAFLQELEGRKLRSVPLTREGLMTCAMQLQLH